MLNKLEKWGIKVWCLIDGDTRYAWTWEVYCEKNLEAPQCKKIAKKVM